MSIRDIIKEFIAISRANPDKPLKDIQLKNGQTLPDFVGSLSNGGANLMIRDFTMSGLGNKINDLKEVRQKAGIKQNDNPKE